MFEGSEDDTFEGFETVGVHDAETQVSGERADVWRWDDEVSALTLVKKQVLQKLREVFLGSEIIEAY